jgi:hypothetical protein
VMLTGAMLTAALALLVAAGLLAAHFWR